MKTSVDSVVALVPHAEGSYHVGIPSQRLQKTGQRPNHKWKGPDKISKIYGDWIDDLEQTGVLDIGGESIGGATIHPLATNYCVFHDGD